MAYLPHYDPADVARRADIDRLENRFDRLDDRIDRFEITLTTGLAAVNARLDRLFLALLAGLFVVLAAMAGLVATTL